MEKTIKKSRTAGFLYLTLIVFGVFAELFVRGKILVETDAAATAANILGSQWLFRAGFLSDLMMGVSFVFLALAFYRLFKAVNKTHALALLSIVLVSSAIICLNMLNQFAALLVLNGADYLTVFNQEQLEALSLFFLELHKHGYALNGIFFGLWLFPLGYLVFTSGYFPKIVGRVIGIFLMVGCFGYLADVAAYFLFPGAYDVVSSFATIPTSIGEFSLCGWLVIAGAKIPENKTTLSIK